MLLENVPRYWARVWLKIKTIRQGQEIDTEVPVNVVERPDTIIHLFAAREIWKLDDQGFIRALRQHRGVLERNNVSLGKKAKGLAAGGLWHPDGQVL